MTGTCRVCQCTEEKPCDPPCERDGPVCSTCMSALEELQRRIQSTFDLIQEYEVAARERGGPRSVFANIRALRKLQHRLKREIEEVDLVRATMLGMIAEVARQRGGSQ